MTATYAPGTDLLDTTTLGGSGGVETTYSYDGFGDLSGVLYEAANVPLYEVLYTRDTFGRVETKTEVRPGGTTLRCYEYDASDRLAAVYDAADSNGCTGSQLEAYTYDLNGNRASVTNSAGTVPAVDIVTDNQDRLLEHGDFTYTYNEDGQMETRSQTSTGDVWGYTYDAVGNLREVDPPGMGGTITYVTDPRNRRVGKRVDGTLVQGFLYGDQLNPIAELDGSGALVSRFVYGTSDHVPDYMVRGGATYRFVTDHLGSVVGVFDLGSGTMVQTREYDAYGRIVSETTTPGFSQPFGFAGGLWDEDTGLVRFGARDYRPEVGSWAAKDPLRFEAGDGSLFAYSFSDPANFVDLSGRAPTKLAAVRKVLRQIVKDPRYGHHEAFCWICRVGGTRDWFATAVSWGPMNTADVGSGFYPPPAGLICEASVHTHPPSAPPVIDQFGNPHSVLDTFSNVDEGINGGGFPAMCSKFDVCIAYLLGSKGTIWRANKYFWGLGKTWVQHKLFRGL